MNNQINEIIAKEGQLSKLGGVIKNWKNRWFILTDIYLAYYASKEAKELKGRIPLHAIHDVQACTVPNKDNCFSIFVDERKYIIQAPSTTERDEWLNVIKAGATNKKKKSSISWLVEAADKEGYLLKQGHLVKNWKQRWFVLSGANLYYFRSPQDEILKGVIHLQKGKVTVEKNDLDEHCFLIKIYDPIECDVLTYFIKADTEDIMNDWIQSLRKILTENEDERVLENGKFKKRKSRLTESNV